VHPLTFKENKSFETNYLRIYTSSILTKFSLYGRYLILDYESDLLLAIAQGTMSWQPILASKLAKSAYSPLFSLWYSETNGNIALLILKGLHTMIWLHCENNLVNFGQYR